MRQHIFFHPDCDRRPWHRTRSADPRPEKDEALAGSQLALHTAGGEFRPALKTCAGMKAGSGILATGCRVAVVQMTPRQGGMVSREGCGIEFFDEATEKFPM